jgi:ABC-type Mn2+/Zn2+ transport system permease subunit
MFNVLPYRSAAMPKDQHSEATIRSISLVIAVYFGSTTSLAIVRDTSFLEIVAFHAVVFGILAAAIFHR